MKDRQKSGCIPRIGILSPATEPGMREWWNKLVQGLHEAGYVDGSNIEFVWRFADGKFERLAGLAAELAQLELDIVMPATPPAILAAKSAFPATPIVFPLGSDPVETGLVSSVERPGGNITGMATMSWRQSRARLALVREILPDARRVALIRHSANAALDLQVKESRTAARELDLELLVLEFSSGDGIEPAFETAGEKRAEAVLPLSEPVAYDNRKKIGRLSMQGGIPVVSPFQEMTQAGCVLGYGPDLSVLFRSSASIVDRILKGSRPGDIPIGEPPKFDLSINLTSARALGLTIPDALMARATSVIE
jgi:putative tryptophan/tyrosine transport system substrate-binding protein